MMSLRKTLVLMWVVLAAVVAPGSAGGQESDEPKPFLIALDPKTGEELWRDQSPDPGIRRVLGEAQGLVFVYETECVRAAGATPPASLIAFDRASGEERWRTPIRVVADVLAQTQFSILGETIVVIGRDGKLHGLDPTSGDVRWKAASGGLFPAAGSADVVLLASKPGIADPDATGLLRAISRKTGEVLWSYENDQFGPLSRVDVAVVGRDTAVVTLYADRPTQLSAAGAVFGFDLRSGNNLWEVPLTGDPPFLTESGWELLFGASPGTPLTAYEPQTQEQRWVAPVVVQRVEDMAGDVVLTIAPGSPTKWIALDADTGAVLWEASRTGEAVALGRGTLVDATRDERGPATAIDTRIGEVRWTRRAPRGGGRLWFSGRNVYVSGGCVLVDES